MLVLTLPAALGGLLEELQFQVCALLAGRMGEAQAAANSCCEMTTQVSARFFSRAGT